MTTKRICSGCGNKKDCFRTFNRWSWQCFDCLESEVEGEDYVVEIPFGDYGYELSANRTVHPSLAPLYL